MRLVFDLETDGLLPGLTKIHCINCLDLDTERAWSFNDGGSSLPKDGTILEGLMALQQADELVGHNIVKFDIPAIQQLYPLWKSSAKVFDTMVAASVIWTDLADKDHAAIKAGRLPHAFQQKGLIGKQSLAAWGWRTGEHKASYSGTWEHFNDDMDRYARQDVIATARLHALILSKQYSQQCLDLEHEVARIIGRQERQGFAIDMDKLAKLTEELQIESAVLTAELQGCFPPWKERQADFIPKRDNKKMGYVAGVPVERWKEIVFNPGSRQHIADRLKAMRGWNPTVFTPSGQPQVDDKVLAELPWPEAKKLARYLEVQKHRGLVEGWFKKARQGKDGVFRLHGSVRTNGAVTGRMTHSEPNLAQVPKTSEFRECFIPSPGKVLVGCDAEGLELRMLAHYMARYDNGDYGRTVVEGKKSDGTDVHTVNQRAVGLHTRDSAKTWIYAFLYGAGDFKLGTIVVADFTEEERNDFYKTNVTKRAREAAIKRVGATSRSRVLSNLPALGRLVSAVQSAAARGYLAGLDGRRLHVRGSHAALNTLLQGAGAIVMKQALVLLDSSTNGTLPFVANVHDEFQFEEDLSDAEQSGRLAADSIRGAGESFRLRCPLSGSFGIGSSWAETH